ncbi:hypothetical protein [Streptomyces sp. NPDC002122]|uniref:hypothetical protein n=1 Tax=Streptomyces sp. NPDC002122 TaxID=3154407 RepID=UPI00331C2982
MWELSLGNPLFALELARAVRDGDGPAGAPEGVRQLVAERLGRLGPAARRVVDAVAVAGQDAALTEVLDVARRGGHPRLSAAEATEAVEAAVAASVVEERRVVGAGRAGRAGGQAGGDAAAARGYREAGTARLRAWALLACGRAAEVAGAEVGRAERAGERLAETGARTARAAALAALGQEREAAEGFGRAAALAEELPYPAGVRRVAGARRGGARACFESSAVCPKGRPGGVWCVRSQGGGSPRYWMYQGDPDNAASVRARRRQACGTFETRPGGGRG